VRDVNNHLKMNERVKVKVLNVNPTNGKVDLSLKQAAVPEGPLAATMPVLPRPYKRWGRGKRELPEGADPVFEELARHQAQPGSQAGRQVQVAGAPRGTWSKMTPSPA
jgi:predicted RNA-binding protein with RPS1 domain